ncbi:MAG: pyridoxamine 5'-phosphate oxidase family protein [Desulfovibrionaceae bacterium]
MRKGIITDRESIYNILDNAELLHLALCDEEGPFCVPVNHVRIGGRIVIHSGLRGRKAAALRSGQKLGFSAVTDVRLKQGEQACSWGYYFRSVRGTGLASFVEEETQRRSDLEALVKRYTNVLPPINADVLAKTAIFSIEITEATGRVRL